MEETWDLAKIVGLIAAAITICTTPWLFKRLIRLCRPDFRQSETQKSAANAERDSKKALEGIRAIQEAIGDVEPQQPREIDDPSETSPLEEVVVGTDGQTSLQVQSQASETAAQPAMNYADLPKPTIFNRLENIETQLHKATGECVGLRNQTTTQQQQSRDYFAKEQKKLQRDFSKKHRKLRKDFAAQKNELRRAVRYIGNGNSKKLLRLIELAEQGEPALSYKSQPTSPESNSEVGKQTALVTTPAPPDAPGSVPL